MRASEKKISQLGMSLGKAGHLLRMALLFKYIKLAGHKFCYRCEREIENLKEFSLDHKKNWLDSFDPKNTFFDLENIAFSHRKCNYSVRRNGEYLNKHGYRGVYFSGNDGRKNKYRAYISENGKRINLGSFETPRDAAIRYNQKALEVFGEKAVLNKIEP